MHVLENAELMKLPFMRRFWYWWWLLKRDFPVKDKVRIRTYASGKLFQGGHRVYGLCNYSETTKMFTIHVERNTDLSIMVDTMRHEYAHVLTWKTGTKTHCRRFWDAYAKIYRFYIDGEK